MRYAVVELNAVTNIIIYDGQQPYTPITGELLPCGNDINIGWHYTNGEFTNPNAEDEGNDE